MRKHHRHPIYELDADPRDEAAVLVESPAVGSEYDARHARQSAGEGAECADLRTIQMDDPRILIPKKTHQREKHAHILGEFDVPAKGWQRSHRYAFELEPLDQRTRPAEYDLDVIKVFRGADGQIEDVSLGTAPIRLGYDGQHLSFLILFHVLIGRCVAGIVEYTMRIVNKKEPILLGIGDILILAASLYITLALRYEMVPSSEVVSSHLLPFSIIFLYSLIVFYISGLYGRVVGLARLSVPGTVIRAQIVNALLAIALFYFFRDFDVTPKTNLFIYILLSTALLILWRFGSYSVLSLRKKYPAVVIGATTETDELVREMRDNPRIGLSCRQHIDPAHAHEGIVDVLEHNGSEFHYIVADAQDPAFEKVLPSSINAFFQMPRSSMPTSCMRKCSAVSRFRV